MDNSAESVVQTVVPAPRSYPHSDIDNNNQIFMILKNTSTFNPINLYSCSRTNSLLCKALAGLSQSVKVFPDRTLAYQRQALFDRPSVIHRSSYGPAEI